ncbi:MAG: DUF4388 domain-containing protein [Myxococcaceae bacterium]
MTVIRKILIADPDFEAARALSKALRQKGYQVHYAPDGSKALEVSVLRHPDLALFDDACRLIEAKTFAQILRTNPRTEDIPVVLTTTSYEADKVRAFRDGFLSKPYNVDEVLSRIDHIFRRSEAAKELKGEAREIEGTLTQLSIPDLLQILAMNRRSGRLNLTRGSERGEIHVQEGRPVNARIGLVEGEKALFRLLSWSEGSFAFAHGGPPPRVRITRAMDDALLEGVRQGDEVARLLPALPPRNAPISLAPEAEISKDQHPVTAQVVELLRQPRTLAELLDLAPATDLDVMVVLGTLMQKGVARIAEGEQVEGRGPLLGPAEVHALRSRLFRGRVPARAVVAKVFVLGQGSATGRRLLREISGITRVAAEPQALRSGFGTLGQFEVSEGLKIDFCVLPSAEAARPLWRPFSTGAVGALLLDTSEPAVKLARYFGWEVRLPLVVVGAEVPAPLAGAPAGAAAVGDDLLEALRALLVQSLNPVQPDHAVGLA